MRWIKKIAGIRGMARLEISLGLGLVLAVLLASQSSFSQVCRQVRQDTLRLHIRAASDSAADQADKLAVRDAVVQAAAVLFDGQTSREEAVAIASQNLDLLQQVANDTLQSRGSGSSATVTLTDMLFDTTWYQDFTMPAGRLCASTSARLREKTGGACCFRPCVCQPPRPWKPLRSIPTKKSKYCKAATSCGLRRWNGGSGCGTARPPTTAAEAFFSGNSYAVKPNF